MLFLSILFRLILVIHSLLLAQDAIDNASSTQSPITTQQSKSTLTTTIPTTLAQTTAVQQQKRPLNIKLGLLFANGTQRLRYLFGFGQSAPAISIAMSRIRKEGLIDNINFTYSWMMTDCSQSLSFGYTTQMIMNSKVDAILGPPCLTSALIAGYGATFYNTPIYVWGATVVTDLSNATLYTTMSNINVNTYKRFYMNSVPSVYSRHLHDTMYLYALALNKSIQADGASTELIRNGSYMRSFSKGQFTGMTGTVKLNENGTREPVFYLTGMDAKDVPTIFMSISVTANIVTIEKQYTDESKTIWAKNVMSNGKRPLYKPSCGYTGSECPQNLTIYISIGSGLILLLLLAAMTGIGYAIREKMKEQERLTRECMIPYIELKNLNEMRSVEQLKELDQGKSMRSMQSSQSGSTAKLTVDSKKKLETEAYAFFVHNKEVVFGCKYPVRIRLNAEDFVHMRKLRQLDNDNLNKFYGICPDAPIFYAIWKWCQRGSLQDLIAKEQYVTDSFVMFALMRDITNGLIALHASYIGAHGFLTSENCLINDRWQVKISDFGLNVIRASQPTPKKKKLLWTAPEILRENDRFGTKEGDVYSFAIICTELYNRETVWNGVEREDDVDEIIYRLKRTNSAIPHRPQLNAREDISANLLHLLRDCWAEKPSERPKMELVRTLLKQMVRDGNQNLMDYVFGMLEQYASSLEQEVDERTKELVEEKRKSDILLYRMLPKQVAEKLKLGESVEPETFALATIFFSDVVSFTTLAGKCTPLQVVNLLNNLYTSFDNIIDLYDAYKVETIGDGYLICSGIPKRNGDQHVREIADLSFAFLRAVANFRIDHMPTERMNLRIGFHTGPAVAGVVGLTMPRYCLFGDSVNTASRMESSGKAGHIHISSVANHLLTKVIGGYLTEPRGEVIIKGKGVMETFWLLGQDRDPHNDQHQTSQGPMYSSYVNQNS